MRNNSQPALDEAIQRWMAAHHTAWLDGSAKLVTQLGSTPFVLTVTAVVAVVTWRRARADERCSTAALCIGGEIILEVVARVVKAVVGRPRPPIDQAVVVLANSSLPAAHVARALYAACLVAAAVRPGRVRRGVIALGSTVVIAVSASRVVLGTHWFSDTLAAIPLGLFVVWWPARRVDRSVRRTCGAQRYAGKDARR